MSVVVAAMSDTEKRINPFVDVTVVMNLKMFKNKKVTGRRR
jgi:hypothetical protein